MSKPSNLTPLTFDPNHKYEPHIVDAMIKELGEFGKYVFVNMRERRMQRVEDFLSKHTYSKEKQETISLNLFLADHLFHRRQAKVSDARNYMKMYGKNHPLRTFLTSWLKVCERVQPKFYFIHKINGEGIMELADLETHRCKIVFVGDPLACKPKKGSILMGMLLPLGQGTYTTYFDFYHFDPQVTEYLFYVIKSQYTKENPQQTSYENFLDMFSLSLQIEAKPPNGRNIMENKYRAVIF